MQINNSVNPFNIVKPQYDSTDNLQNDKPQRPSFEEYLKNSLKDVNELQIEADRQTTLLATGQAENVHDVTIAATKAKISLDLTMAVRSKVIDAYKEIMRMQV